LLAAALAGAVGLGLWLRPKPLAAPVHPPAPAPLVDPSMQPSPSSPRPAPVAVPRFAVAGRVLRGGAPAAGARVLVDGQPRGEPTDAQGRFTLVLEALPAVLRAAADGAVGTPAELSRAPEAEVVLALSAPSTLTLQVRDLADARPLVGAHVTDARCDVDAATDGDGQAALALPPGACALLVQAEGYAPQTVPVLGQAGEARTLPVLLARQRRISGTVQDRAGTALAGAELQAMDLFGFDAQGRPARSDGQGRFVLPVDADGSLRVVARLDGYATTAQVLQAGARDARLVLGRGAELGGHVRDAQGLPVEGAVVTLREQDVELTPSSLRRATTDAEGKYDLSGIDPGERTLELTPPGHPMEPRGTVKLVDEAYLGLDLVVELSGRTVSGTVTEEATSQPLPGVDVLIARTAADGGRPPPPLSARSGPDGRFRIPGVPAGLPALCAQSYPRPKVCVDLGPGDVEVAVVLAARAQARGRVLDAHGAALEHYWVNGRDQRSPDGVFHVDRSDERTYRVTSPGYAPGTLTDPLDGGESVAEVDLGELRLTPAARTTVTVLDPDGHPISGAGVFHERVGQASHAGHTEAVTDSQGEAVLPLEPQTTCLRASHPRYAPSPAAQCPHAIEPGGSAFTLQLQRAAQVTGRVSAGGHPVAGAVVLLPGRDRNTMTDAHGDYALPGLEPGELTLTVVRLEDLSVSGGQRKKVLLHEGEQATLDFGSEGQSELSVHVKSAGPADRVMVLVAPGVLPDDPDDIPEGAQVRLLKLDASGASAVFPSLAPGTYTVRVVAQPEDTRAVSQAVQVLDGASPRVELVLPAL
jgi:protocatechuate 3,4-dioxygenase beta subunit